MERQDFVVPVGVEVRGRIAVPGEEDTFSWIEMRQSGERPVWAVAGAWGDEPFHFDDVPPDRYVLRIFQGVDVYVDREIDVLAEDLNVGRLGVERAEFERDWIRRETERRRRSAPPK